MSRCIIGSLICNLNDKSYVLAIITKLSEQNIYVQLTFFMINCCAIICVSICVVGSLICNQNDKLHVILTILFLQSSAQVNTVIVSNTLARDEQDSSWDDEYIYILGHEPEKMQVPQINDYNGVEMKNAD